MGTTQPIRNRKELQKFSTYYQTVKPHPRNYALIILGLNTALRISDLLQLQWSDVYDFYTQRFREHLLILEQKTGKQNYIALNKNARNALRWYMDACFPQESDYLFCKNTDRQHLQDMMQERLVLTQGGFRSLLRGTKTQGFNA